jgi:hypothetical protein
VTIGLDQCQTISNACAQLIHCQFLISKLTILNSRLVRADTLARAIGGCAEDIGGKRYSQIPMERGADAPHLPRVPSLKAFERRPPCALRAAIHGAIIRNPQQKILP